MILWDSWSEGIRQKRLFFWVSRSSKVFPFFLPIPNLVHLLWVCNPDWSVRVRAFCRINLHYLLQNPFKVWFQPCSFGSNLVNELITLSLLYIVVHCLENWCDGNMMIAVVLDFSCEKMPKVLMILVWYLLKVLSCWVLYGYAVNSRGIPMYGFYSRPKESIGSLASIFRTRIMESFMP